MRGSLRPAVSRCSPARLQAADLLSVYQRALQNDPQIREADANRLASRESKPQALAALLPQINASGSYSDVEPGILAHAR